MTRLIFAVRVGGLAIATMIAVACSSSRTPDAGGSVEWVIPIDPAASAGTLSPALLGHYDLSGALFAYDRVPGLVAAMREAGFGEWRIGVGRWESGTLLLPTLTGGPGDRSCQTDLVGLPPQAFAPVGTTDFDVIRQRDWFTFTDGSPVTEAMTADGSRYALAYIRSAIDTAAAFGARPFVNIDLMPRALSAGQTPVRTRAGPIPDPCFNTFTNRLSNAKAADPAVFAAAVVGLVQRIIEGGGGEPARAVTHWEIWNEPEFAYFWDPAFEPAGGLDAFFDMAIQTLVRLDAFRRTTTTPSAQALRFGLGSFGFANTAARLIGVLDSTPIAPGAYVPVDFFSFHSYGNDPLTIVADIEMVAQARRASTRYRAAELVLAEWGPQLDGQGWDPRSMDAALLVSTVIAVGATAGLDRAHHAIFWDYYDEVVRFGLLDNAVRPRPLYHAYRLLAKVVGSGATRLVVTGRADGRVDGGTGAVLASRDAAGKLRVLVVNRGTAARTIRVDLAGGSPTPSRIELFDDPARAPRLLEPRASFSIPGRSIALAELM